MGKWYVNLRQDPKKSEGERMLLSVSRGYWGNRAHVKSKRPNRQVRWLVTPDPHDAPASTGAGNVDPRYVPAAGRTKLTRGTLNGTNEAVTDEIAPAGRFENELLFGTAGGDTFTVTTTKVKLQDTAPASKTLKMTESVETWRRIWYRFNYMNADHLSAYGKIKPILKRIFEEVFVELVEDGKPEKIDDEPQTTDVDHLVDGKLPLTKKGLELRLALVNVAADDEEYSARLEAKATPSDVVSGDRAANDHGTWTFRFAVPPRNKRYVPAKDFLVSFTIKGADRKEPFTNARNELVYRNKRGVEVVTAGSQYTAKLEGKEVVVQVTDAAANETLTDNAALPSPETLTAEIRFRLRRDLGGFSSGANISLTRSLVPYYTANSQQELQGLARVFAHEMAHSLGLVRKTAHDGGADADNAWWYDDTHGGQGNHCSRGTKQVDNTADDAGDFLDEGPATKKINVPDATKPDPICIMFHKRTNQLHGLEFCETCKRHLRVGDMRNSFLGPRPRAWDEVK